VALFQQQDFVPPKLPDLAGRFVADVGRARIIPSCFGSNP